MRHGLQPATTRTAWAKAASAVAAAMVAGALLASCSSGADSSDADTSTDTTAAASSTDQSQITQVTEDFIAAINAGQVSALPPMMCAANTAQLTPEETADVPESAEKADIDSIDQITVAGDTATAVLTLSARNDTSKPPQSVQIGYANEDGWKVCK